MKKSLIFTLSILASGIAMAQDKSVEKSVEAVKAVPVTPTKDCKCSEPVKKPVKRVVKKAPVKKVETPKVVAPVVEPEKKAAITGVDYFHIPANAQDKSLDVWNKKTAYDNIDVRVNYKEMPFKHFERPGYQLQVELIDKRTGEFVDANSLKKIDVLGTDFSVVKVDTDLKNLTQKLSNHDGESVILSDEIENASNTCKVLFTTYHLKAEEKPQTVIKFVNHDNKLVDEMPQNCDRTDVSRETAFHTEKGTIVNVGFNQSKINKKNLSFVMYTTRNGKEFFPSGLRAFAFGDNFKSIHFLPAKANPKGPYFGTQFEKVVADDNYNVLIGFETELGTDWITVKNAIR